MPPSSPTVVLFDLGGVLIDWNPRHLYRQFFDDPAEMERFLAEVCPPEWNLALDRGRAFAEAIEEATGRHPGHRLHIEAYFTRWIEMIAGPIVGTVDLLEELAAAGRPLFALSNWSAETFPLVRRDPAYAFLDRFRHIFLSGELGMVKPEPDIYRHVLGDIARSADECLFIDDNRANVHGAAALGLHTHLFETPENLRSELVRLNLLG